MAYTKFKTPFGDLYYLVGKKIVHEYKDEAEAKEIFRQIKSQFDEYSKHKDIIDEAIDEASNKNMVELKDPKVEINKDALDLLKKDLGEKKNE